MKGMKLEIQFRYVYHIICTVTKAEANMTVCVPMSH